MRVSGLLLTVFFVLTPCVVAIDLVAWQCYRYGVPGCSRLPDQLNFLAALDPGQRIAFATVVPMAAVALLWWLSKASLARYESVVDPLDKPPALSSTQILLHPKLWNGTARTLRLQRYHLTAGIATVIAFTGVHVLRVDHARLQNGWAVLLWATSALSLVLLLVSALAVTITHHDDVEPVAASRRRLPGPGGRHGGLRGRGRRVRRAPGRPVDEPPDPGAHERGLRLHRPQHLADRRLRRPHRAAPERLLRWPDEGRLGGADRLRHARLPSP